MLTRKGILLAALAVVLTLGGRIFAIIELYVLGATCLVLVGVSFAYVLASRVRVEMTRVLHPARVHCGDDSRVELSLRNIGARTTPVFTVRDPFDGGRRWARFLVPPVAPGTIGRAAYRLPTESRGVFEIGPLELNVGDPFGLALATTEIAQPTQLIVYPRVDELVPLPFTLGHDPRTGADRATAVGVSGDDFYALRPYEMGDDLRRVHWPSTARSDELMIRQEELPWQGRATVFLDVRRVAHTAESLELAISAAASIVMANGRRGALVRLVATDGFDSGFAPSGAHLEAILTRLARMEPTAQANLNGPLGVLRRGTRGGALAMVSTANVATGDLDGVARLSGRYGRVVQVLFERSAWEPGAGRAAAGRARADAAGAGPARSGATIVRPRAGLPFAQAWNTTFAPHVVGAR